MLLLAYRRALAAVAALGSVLALALVVLSPTSAAAAPAQDCDPDYPASVSTTTSLNLSSNFVRYPGRVVAFVQVASGAGTPTGTVTLSAGGSSFQLKLRRSGFASKPLPRLAADRTYSVTASYSGGGCYAGSSDSTSLTVFAAGTSVVSLDARDIRSGQRPRVTGRVTTDTDDDVSGTVTVTISHDGESRERTVELEDGRFSATFGSVDDRGTWTATVTVPDTDDYDGSSASTTFEVRRR